MERYYNLILQGAHILSAKWRDHLTASAELLPDLPHREWQVLNDSRLIAQHITQDKLQVIHPYLPEAYALDTMRSLAEQGLLDASSGDGYRFSSRTERYFHNVEAALVAYAESMNSLLTDQAYRLLSLTTALLDKIMYGPNPAPIPILTLAVAAITPSEHPLAQIQQRLFALLLYRDDVHIAAWRTEGYSAPAIRAATFLLTASEAVSIEQFNESPLFYDDAYTHAALSELVDRGDALETGTGYALTARGIMQRERVEQLTNEYFAQPFDNRLSESARKDWIQLMATLIDSAYSTQTEQPKR